MPTILEFLYSQNPWWRNSSFETPEYKRPLYHILMEGLRDKRDRRIITVTGPRRVGKTTLLRQLANELAEKDAKRVLYFSLDDPAWELMAKEGVFGDILDVYEKDIIGEDLQSISSPVYIFVDEIQYLQGFERWLKRYYDLEYKIRFVVSGSSATSVIKGTQEFLVGRAKDYSLYPFSFREFLDLKRLDIAAAVKDAENAEKMHKKLLPLKSKIVPLFNYYLLRGGYPEAVEMRDWQEYLISGVVRKSIFRDISTLYGVRNPEYTERILAYIAFVTNKTMSANSIASDLGIDKETVESHLRYLESSYLILHLRNYSGGVKMLKRNKKFYIIDVGLRHAIVKEGEQQFAADHQKQSIAAENAIISDLFYRGKEMFFWRERHEIDVVIKNKALVPIEIKYTNDVKKAEIKGLISFMESFGLSRGMVITKDVLRKEIVSGREIAFVPAWLFLLLDI
ncbi:MAG: ATP-binding protein [Candidatus Aenigmarchaeota archaeon]|nr:ATP-binding protein [Candidatus Aenigmarchaeota archaeon]